MTFLIDKCQCNKLQAEKITVMDIERRFWVSLDTRDVHKVQIVTLQGRIDLISFYKNKQLVVQGVCSIIKKGCSKVVRF